MPPAATMFTAHCNACQRDTNHAAEADAERSLYEHFPICPARAHCAVMGSVVPAVKPLAGWTTTDDRAFQAMFR